MQGKVQSQAPFCHQDWICLVSRSGSASGSCAAGFGVCCVSTSSTCGASVSTNITYIRNRLVHSLRYLVLLPYRQSERQSVVYPKAPGTVGCKGFLELCLHGILKIAGLFSIMNLHLCKSWTWSEWTSLMRNPGYPSSYTPTATGTCSVTVRKTSDNICQLREGPNYRKS